jgi:uncharacterized RDD family membrane protein YckC
MVYEGILLFGIVFIAGYLFSTLTQQRNGLTHHNELMVWIGFVLAAYFVWFWTHGGQTLPMKTWRMKVVDAQGKPVGAGRAVLRYIVAWMWFLPPLALHPVFGFGIPLTLIVFGVWVVAWAGMVWVDPARQFLHDRFVGTRIVNVDDVVVSRR